MPATYLKAKDAVLERDCGAERRFGAGYQSRTAGYSRRAVSRYKRRTGDYLVWGAAEGTGTGASEEVGHGWESTVGCCRDR